MIRAVLFDLDGTLVDSFALIRAAFRDAGRTVLGRCLTEDDVTARWGEPLHVRAAHLAADRAEAFVAAYTAYYDAHHDGACRSFAGVPEMLAALASGGRRLGVVTSKRRRSTRRVLESCGLGGWFQAVVSVEDVRMPKPSAEPVAEALARLGAAAGDALMVGDGVFDIEAARAAGVRSAAALWGTGEREALLAASPDYVAVRPEDIVLLSLSG